jgi:hypothetical protein
MRNHALLTLLILVLVTSTARATTYDDATAVLIIKNRTHPGACGTIGAPLDIINGTAITLDGGRQYYALGGVAPGGTNNTTYGLTPGAYWRLNEPGVDHELLRVYANGTLINTDSTVYAELVASFPIHDPALGGDEDTINAIFQIVRFEANVLTTLRIEVGPYSEGDPIKPALCASPMGPLADRDANGYTHLSILDNGESPTQAWIRATIENNSLNAIDNIAFYVPLLIFLLVAGLLIRSLMENA